MLLDVANILKSFLLIFFSHIPLLVLCVLDLTYEIPLYSSISVLLWNTTECRYTQLLSLCFMF